MNLFRELKLKQSLLCGLRQQIREVEVLNDKRLYEALPLSYLPMLLTLHFHSSAFLSSLLQLCSLRKAIDFIPISPHRSLCDPLKARLLHTYPGITALFCCTETPDPPFNLRYRGLGKVKWMWW